jgi:hypothetical protein
MVHWQLLRFKKALNGFSIDHWCLTKLRGVLVHEHPRLINDSRGGGRAVSWAYARAASLSFIQPVSQGITTKIQHETSDFYI